MARDPDLPAGEAAAATIQSSSPTPVSLTSPPTVALAAALAVLANFNARHKNQHRVATYWWAPFGQLRRHAAKLHAELTTPPPPPPPPPAGAVAGSPVSGQEFPPAAIDRARWIQSNLVSKAYLAFSRITTDRQFATVGLVLLGVLAQIHAVLKSILAGTTQDEDPDDQDLDQDDKDNVPPQKANTATTGQPKIAVLPLSAAAAAAAIREAHHDDLGVPVAREEEPAGNDNVDDDEEVVSPPKKKKKNKRPRPEAHDSDSGSDGVAVPRPLQDTQPPPPPKKKKKMSDETEEEEGDLVKRRPTTEEDVDQSEEKTAEAADGKEKKHRRGKKEKKGNKDKKDKKRKRGGDEFDDLFSGLL